jgi:predicted O-methyltransferase YrrM
MQVLQRVVGNKDNIRVPLGALEVLNWAPAQLTSSERLMLFTLIYSLRPQRYLEIGTFEGGSALIVAAAMDAASIPGTMACVDIRPKVDPKNWDLIKHRASMVLGDAAQVLPEAQKVAGGPFDFVFIDGDHKEASVVRDATKVLRVLAPQGYVLFHDGFNPGVKRGVETVLEMDRSSWIDYGTITREYTEANHDGRLEPFCGFRFIQHRSGDLLGRMIWKCEPAARATVTLTQRLARLLVGSHQWRSKQD